MTNTVFSLPKGKITKPQTVFFVDILRAGNKVLFAQFGDVTPVHEFRELAAQLPELFDEDAIQQADEINSYFMRYDETTAGILHLIDYVKKLAKDTNAYSFNENLNSYASYYADALLDAIEEYEIEED